MPAEPKVAVVAQSISDQLWTDDRTGRKYLRTPFKLGLDAQGASVRNPEAGCDVRVFEYQVPAEFSLQFIPMFGPHYITTTLKAPPSYSVRAEVWDAFMRQFKGTLLDGTTTELCRSEKMRQNGFPLCYNAVDVVVAEPGDIVMLAIAVPTDAPVPLLVGPDKKPLVELFLRCYKLVPEMKNDG